MKKIILLSGKAEAGKTTAAEMIKYYLEKEGYKVSRLAYGDYVKETAKQLWGWDGKKDEHGRHLLQWWGTDVIRKKNPNFWVDTIIRLLDVAQDELGYIIIDDCRFPNEIEQIKGKFDNCITVRVSRPGYKNKLTPEQRNHPSETALDGYGFDYRLVAEDKDELDDVVSQFLEHIL